MSRVFMGYTYNRPSQRANMIKPKLFVLQSLDDNNDLTVDF